MKNESYENMAVTVSQVNRYIKEKISLMTKDLNSVLVKGEISNFKRPLHRASILYAKRR